MGWGSGSSIDMATVPRIRATNEWGSPERLQGVSRQSTAPSCRSFLRLSGPYACASCAIPDFSGQFGERAKLPESSGSFPGYISSRYIFYTMKTVFIRFKLAERSCVIAKISKVVCTFVAYTEKLGVKMLLILKPTDEIVIRKKSLFKTFKKR